MTGIGDVKVDHHGGDVWVVSLLGEHDLSNIGDLDECLRQVHTHGTHVVFDLSQASFIDSSVISRIFHEAHNAAVKPADGLTVIAPRGSQPRRALDLTGMPLRIIENRTALA